MEYQTTYKSISRDGNPLKNGRYLVKFYARQRPEYDCTELAWRGFYDGAWDNTTHKHKGDGYEMIGWYDPSPIE